MKYLLIGINSKYSHTNLAIRILRAYAKSPEVSLCEYTINEQSSKVMADIYKQKADALFFSCYIWNIEYIKKLCTELKKITAAKIILGGPEVSFNPQSVMNECSAADACIIGEGEETFSELIKNGLNFESTDGIVWRKDNIIKTNGKRRLTDINKICFPYTAEELKALSGRLIYYETARGCPFNCSYCMSSTIKGVRYRNIETVKKELKFFIDNNVKIVKLTDRTFNTDPKRACEIFKFLIKNKGSTTFHFEIAAHILNDKIFDVLKQAPKNLFQFEIGVQSTNIKTLTAINRKTDFNKIAEEVKRIKALGNIHIHLDLIAGLPYETLNIFKKSFNDVFALRPDMLQLGFLKLLHGTEIRNDKEHSFLYSDFPPYEVLQTKYISYEELNELKNIEEITDKFYNSGAFSNSIEFLMKKYETPYELFYDISKYFEKNKLFEISLSRIKLFDILAEYVKKSDIEEAFFDMLKLDYFLDGANKSPAWELESDNGSFYKRRFELIEKNPEIFKSFNEPLKEIIKKVRFERFYYDVFNELKKEETILAFFKDGTVHKMNKI